MEKGFTLIEILVVIGIVALLSVLAITGYSDYRRGALTDLMVDDFVSQLSEMRSKAVYGGNFRERLEEIRGELEGGDAVSLNEEGASTQCFGVYFKKNGDSFGGVVFSQDFVGKKVWRFDDWYYQGCESDLNRISFPEFSEENRIFEDELVGIYDLKYFQNGIDVPVDSFALRFAPPNGVVEVLYDERAFRSDYVSGDALKFLIGYGETGEERREVIFDML